jgi:hypothetical protein
MATALACGLAGVFAPSASAAGLIAAYDRYETG